MTIAAIIAADLHLSDSIWANYPSLRGDSFYALSQVIELARKNGCPLVLAGDNLELLRSTSLTSSTVSAVNSSIETMRQAGLPLYFIDGQHDMAKPPWLSAINPWATNVSDHEFVIAGRKWFGLSYREGSFLASSLSSLPRDIECLVTHQRWAEFEGGSFSQGRITSLLKANLNLKLFISGDLHKFKAIEIEKCLCLSPGATHKRAVNEPNKHYVFGLSNSFEATQFKLKSRPVVEVVIGSQDHWIVVKAKLRSLLTEASERAVAIGIPVTVAVPMLIIEDQANVGAVEDARTSLKGVCHVFNRKTKVAAVFEDDTEQLLGMGSYQHGDKVDNRAYLIEAVDRWARENCSDVEVARLLSGMVNGEHLLNLRDSFMARIENVN